MSATRYEVRSVRVQEFKSGPRVGQRKPISLPKGAIPCGVSSGWGLIVYFLMPVSPTGKETE